METGQISAIHPTGEFSYTLTAQDVIAANRINLRAHYRKARTYRTWAIVAGVYALLALVITGRFDMIAVIIASIIGILGAIGVMIGCGLAGWILLPARSRKSYNQQKVLQREQRATIDADAITIDAQNVHVRQPWDELVRWNENSQMMLLYPSDRMFHILPEPALDNNLRAQIREHLTAAGVPKDR